jgi:ketosteroid isomerase-like protein
MIATHPNVELLRHLDEAMLRGDMEAFFGGYTDDVMTHLSGRSSLAGDYHGVDNLKDVFDRFMQASGEYSFENHAYLADDEHGVIMQRTTMRRDGRTFATDEVFVMHFRDGQISEMWYVPVDQAGVDAWLGGKA